MVKLVGVFQGKKARSVDCKSRRYMPLEIESDLTMVMALDDFCMACGTVRPIGKKNSNGDVDVFLRNYNCLDKDELAAAFMVTLDDTLDVLSQNVNCVGCRRSVENLYHSLKDCDDDSALDPLIVTKEGFISINREHVNAPESLANLFCHQVARLARLYLNPPAGKKIVAKRGGRCPSHALDQKKITSGYGTWQDTWDSMEKECKEEVVLLPFTNIRATLDKYLKKHSFCCECANMVNKAFTYLIEEGKEPARAAGEKTGEDKIGEDGSRLNEDGSVNLFSGISACTKDGHVHVQCETGFISQLLLLAEPELSGLKQERHAKTIEIAQKEVLICIGITLYNRFNRIQLKLREGEQTCDLLCFVSLLSLRKSLDIAAERKRGITDLDLICQEIELLDREKERRQARKREKKTKQQQKKRDLKGKEQAMLAQNASSKAEMSDSGLSSGYSGDTSPPYSREDVRLNGGSWVKGGSPDLMLNYPTVNGGDNGGGGGGATFPAMNKSAKKGKARCTSSCTVAATDNCCVKPQSNNSTTASTVAPTTNQHQSNIVDITNDTVPPMDKDSNNSAATEVPSHGGQITGGGGGGGLLKKKGIQCSSTTTSLMDMLDQDESDDEDEECGIPAEEIKLFHSMVPQLHTQRQQLRENLREKFAALCEMCESNNGTRGNGGRAGSAAAVAAATPGAAAARFAATTAANH